MTVEIAQNELDMQLASEVGKQVGRLLVETQGWPAGKAYVEGAKAAVYGAELALEVLRMSGLLVDVPTGEQVDQALDAIADDLGIGHRVKSRVIPQEQADRPKGIPIL